MIARLAWLELRQQLGGRVFWIVFAVSVLMVTGAMAIDELRVGLPRSGALTGAAAIVRTHQVWSLFFLFTAAAMVGEAVLRDRTSGFAELVGATPVNPRAYALGRFAGATGALLLCFLSVPAALAAGGVLLGAGPGSAAAYVLGWGALAMPNLLLSAALFFALALATRSMAGCLIGAAAVLTLYGLAGESGPEWAALADPFGFAAVAQVTSGWSAARLDAAAPPFVGVVLANRVFWLGVAIALLGLAVWLAGRGGRPTRRPAPAAILVNRSDAASEQPRLLRSAAPWRVTLRQILWQARFESARIIRTPVFAVLLLLGLANAVAAAARVTGTPATVEALTRSFQLVPVVVVLFFAGELFWAESEHRVAPLIAATPARASVPVLAKLAALALILVSLAVASGAAGAATEVIQGGTPSAVAYLSWYVLPRWYDWLLLGVLALFLQSLAANKIAGWGYMVFYLIGSLALNRLGWQDPHYRYGSYPGAPLPPALSGAPGVGWYRLGWGLVALAMVVLACRRPRRPV
ncbi:ABC transporter permease [Sphingomonas jatrophae]|uniref:ABC-2 type transport system permease protein n=1 Tax=Sphingomonas jatrophae TaxID=1166337 RepID=A0A1I6KZL2_9SPHN|nr:hypothetical protein [Sphingomonas jatrophae]SFR96438.1 hypothetical protein SAMN05192580_2004 [Sphingomonas jatrophae]